MLRRMMLTLIAVGLLINVPAESAPRPDEVQVRIARILSNLDIPAEWDGQWATVDSLYICEVGSDEVGLFFTTVGIDTLCGGKPVFTGDGDASECSGTASATTITASCRSLEYMDGCLVTSTGEFSATRVGDSFVRTFRIESSGVMPGGTPCNPTFPCLTLVSHGTRFAPAPAAYCATPAEQATWGRIKSRYR